MKVGEEPSVFGARKKTPSKSKTLDGQVAKDLRGRPMFLGEAKELLKVWRVEKVAWETEKRHFID